MLVLEVAPSIEVTLTGPKRQTITLTLDQLPTFEEPTLPLFDPLRPVQIGRVIYARRQWRKHPTYCFDVPRSWRIVRSNAQLQERAS